MELVLVERNGLIDFYDLILPDVYSQLNGLDRFEDNGLACVGALEDGQPVGALVFGFLEEPAIEMYSIYTALEHRDRGIGSRMMRAMISHALQTFPFRDGGIPVLQVQADYILPTEDSKKFENFLKKNSFRKFTDLGEIYTLSGQKAAAQKRDGNYPVHTFTELAPEAAEEMAYMLEEGGLDAEVDFSCVAGTPEDPDGMMIACYGAGNIYYLHSRALKKEMTEEAYRQLLGRTASEICKEDPDCTLIVQTAANEFPEIWKSLADDTAKQAEAVLYAVFDEEV